jgi:SAM-dependent methyltransferase
MADAAQRRSGGAAFDEVAEEYDRHRPAYPDELVDRACALAALKPGDRVLEVGCGTGQLTRSLLARGLCVTAVEPGRRLIARARDQLAGSGTAHFIGTRLEDARLPPAYYRAVFSASAIHWIDPDVSWRSLAAALVDGGILALISYFGLEDSRSRDDQHALRAAVAEVAPEQAAAWPRYRELDQIVSAVAQRRENVSEAWAWLGSYDVARRYAAHLFQDANLAVMPSLVEHAADELNSLLATMSFWARLSPSQREALKTENRALHDRLGRPIRSSTVACLLTARRASRTRAPGAGAQGSAGRGARAA